MEIDQRTTDDFKISNGQDIRRQVVLSYLPLINLRVCPVCGRRLGITAFAFFPDGAILHYACMNKNVQKDNL